MHKNSIISLFNAFSRWGDRLFAVIGAFFFAQFPLFYQQYLQQLTGRLAELHWQMELMQRHLADSGRSIAEYLAKLLNYPDVDVALQGAIFKEVLSRYEQSQQAYTALENATVWVRPYVFVKHMSVEAASVTLQHFEPGVLLTSEGLSYAALGLVLGCALFKALQAALSTAWRALRYLPLMLRPRYE